MAVRLVVTAWAHRYARRAASRRARTQDNVTAVQICGKLATPPAGAEPLYELTSQSQLFGEFHGNSQATAVLNVVYGLAASFSTTSPPDHQARRPLLLRLLLLTSGPQDLEHLGSHLRTR
uniref:Kinesin motor domain-containing protein n=1 Tax=Haemonchus contortus TaxID=6289 RepID=A0A7I4Y682_HAECO